MSIDNERDGETNYRFSDNLILADAVAVSDSESENWDCSDGEWEAEVREMEAVDGPNGEHVMRAPSRLHDMITSHMYGPQYQRE